MDYLGLPVLFVMLKWLAELTATVFSIGFFWSGALLFWRYNRLLQSMRTCERCGREVLNPRASHCGRCGQALAA